MRHGTSDRNIRVESRKEHVQTSSFAKGVMSVCLGSETTLSTCVILPHLTTQCRKTVVMKSQRETQSFLHTDMS